MNPTRVRPATLLEIALAAISAAGCRAPDAGHDATARPAPPNLQHVSANVWSGGAPESDEAFASLNELGIRTIVSVDGARPDVAAARRYGLRYVNIPI